MVRKRPVRAFLRFVETVQHCLDVQRIRDVDAYSRALQLWARAHGIVMLDLSGYLEALPTPAEPPAISMFVMAMTGLRDSPTAARGSRRLRSVTS